jgi:carbamoyl-phosphate synthase large subunit
VSAERILVTGAGGLAGVNFVRALRASDRKYYVVGADFNRYHIVYPDVDARYLTPRHTDRGFIAELRRVVERERIDFLHPQPSSEALVISRRKDMISARTFLPPARVMTVAQDKLASQRLLKKLGIPVAKTKAVKSTADVETAFKEIGGPLWVRARHGAGGRLSLLCSSAKEARHWIDLWTLRGVATDEFILQEYLPGRNVAWDSIWKSGKLVTSYARERLEYPFKHISPSGITGTPSVARIIHDDGVNRVSKEAARAIDEKPNGAYSIDLKESSSGQFCVTEVDAGKFHSTMPLWGYIAVKHLRMPWFANMADLYVRLGLGEQLEDTVPPFDLLPKDYYLLRDMDVGAFLWREDGWKEKVL